MSEEVLALGQRDGRMILNSAWTPEEEALLETNGVTKDEVIRLWVNARGDETLNAVIGSALLLKNDQGQERNRPFQTQAEADAEVSAEAGAPEVSGEAPVVSPAE